MSRDRLRLVSVSAIHNRSFYNHRERLWSSQKHPVGFLKQFTVTFLCVRILEYKVEVLSKSLTLANDQLDAQFIL